MGNRRLPHLKAVFQALFVTLLWSASWVFIKIGLQGIAPITFAGLRYVLAALCLLPFALRPAHRDSLRRLSGRGWSRLVILGLLFYTVTQGAQFVGLASLPSVTVSLLLSLTTMVVALLSIPLLSEHLSPLQWVGVFLNIVGVALYFYPVSVPAGQTVALIVVVAGVLANSLSSIIGRRVNREGDLSPLVVTAVSMTIGAAVLLGSGIMVEGLPRLGPTQWGIVLLLAVVNTAFAFSLWNHTLRTLSATESSIINNTMLVQIAILAWLFLGERLTGKEIAGMALTAVGAVLVQLRRRQTAMRDPLEESVTTTESLIAPMPVTLLEAWVERTRRTWPRIAVAMSLVLVLLLITAAYLDGVLIGPINIGYWRYPLLAPAMVAYVLLTQPKLRQLREEAIEAFRPLVALDDEHYHRLLARAPLFNRRREWIALGLGAVAGVLLTRSAWQYFPFWTTLYVILATAIMWGLLGWVVYTSLSGTRLISEVNARTRDVSVFEMSLLEPVGRWSLGVALSYVGGSTLALIFLPRPAMVTETAILYGLLTLTPVLVFFLNMMSTRRIMVDAKRQELRMVRDSLAAASFALKEKAGQVDPEEMSALLGHFAAWVAVENRIREVPEWPYNAGIKRSLAVSLLLPIAVGVIQALLTDMLLRLLG